MRTERCKRHVSNGSVLFLFVGLVMTIVLAAVVFSQSDPQRTTVGEFPSLEPDIASLLPSGAVFTDKSVKEVLRGPSAPSVFVVGFARSRESSVGVVAWDGTKGQYVMTSVVPLTFREGRIDGVPAIEVTPVSARSGSGNVVIASGLSGVSRGSVFVMVLENEVVRPAAFTSQIGIEPFVFHAGPLLEESEQPALEDLNGDGTMEVVVTSRYEAESGEPATRKRAYSWRDGVFVLDSDLTWALYTTMRLFPEPPNGLVP